MRTGQVAAELDISPSTLRRWTERFSTYLSSSASSNGRGSPREYTEADLLILGAIKSMRESGLDEEAIQAALEAERSRAEEHTTHHNLIRVEQGGSIEVLPPAAATTALAQALRQLSETQQALLNSQQAHRDLLGVVVQDNFNLKEENSRLRKRLRQLEEEVSHLKESDWNHRLSLEERLTDLERKKKSWWERLFDR